MATTTVDVHLHLRPHQLRMFRARKRFEVRVVHRRFGKTFLACAELLVDALRSRRKRWQGFYLCPTYTQAKAVAWAYIKDFVGPIPGTQLNESELKATLPNGASIQLLGAEKYDALRGRYADFIVMDETAQIPSTAWTTVLSPMLADRKGRMMAIGTPQGRVNLFYELFEYASNAGDDDWQATLLTVDDTNVLDPAEVARLKRTLRQDEYEQEMLCSWNASMRGSYYGKDMAAAQAEGRITSVKWDKTVPVYVAVDLGWSDAMVAVFGQLVGTEWRILRTDAYESTSIPDMVQHWHDLPWHIEECILPHDARVHELGSGKTRQEVFHSLGLNTTICPNLKIHEGISQVRDFLPNAWFDRDGNKTLIEALNTYRSDYDEVRGVHKLTPLHSWESHWADALRYFVIGKPTGRGWGERPAFKGAI